VGNAGCQRPVITDQLSFGLLKYDNKTSIK
jgi:hypothetical protein